LLILIYEISRDENSIDSILNIILFLSDKGYYEENSAELIVLLDSNFLVSFIERTEQDIKIIKMEHNGKNIYLS
jgi:hypothetical protein